MSKTPVAHLLVYTLERSLTGTIQLSTSGGSSATIFVCDGFPAKVRTSDHVHYLSEVLQHLGLVAEELLAAAGARRKESSKLVGEILKEMGAIDEAGLDLALRVQVERKLEHLFSLPPETSFAYYEGIDTLAKYGDVPTPIDPLPALWRGIRQSPSREHVEAALRRLGTKGVRIMANAEVERFQFARNEAAAVELMRQQPVRPGDLAAQPVGPSVASLLIYCLIITKKVDFVDLGSAHPPPPVVPIAPARAPVPIPTATGPQAFARVQLQAKQVTRSPLVVEEVRAAPRGRDHRLASSVPQAPSPLDIDSLAALAAAAIPQAPLAPMLGANAPIEMSALPDLASSPPSSLSGQRPLHKGPTFEPGLATSEVSLSLDVAGDYHGRQALTPEQKVLKAKILERAAQMTTQNYFQMLGVAEDAPPEIIQKAFFALAKAWHPDRLPAALVDVKDECSKIFSQLTEAHATLSDPARRQEYMTLLRSGGGTAADQSIVQAALEAANEFQKAEATLKRNDLYKALELARRANSLDPDQADYLALVTWIETQLPPPAPREIVLEKIEVLDRCIKKRPNSERAHFWRGMLYKRIDDMKLAVRDFRRVVELNPKNLDAAREVRLYQMRGGSKPPPGPGAPAAPAKAPAQPEKGGGLLGKLFKK